MKAPVFSTIKHYWLVYKAFLAIALKLLLSYRINAIVNAIYVFIYVGGLLFSFAVVFNHTNHIAGFNRQEALLLFAMTFTVWSLVEGIVMEGLKSMLSEDIRTGQFDKILVKPMNPLFLQILSKQYLDAFVYFVPTFGLLFYLIWQLRESITLFSFLAFFVVALQGFWILTMVLSCYAGLAFFFDKAKQTIHTIQTVSDNAMYPPTIFPKALQAMFFSIIPNAVVSYVPVLFLLNRGNWALFIFVALSSVAFYYLRIFIWVQGLKRYSSASS